MNDFTINVHVTLDATDKLASLVQSIRGTAQAPVASATKPEPRKPETKPEARKPETKEPIVELAPEPAAPEISDEELRAIIKECRTATSPSAVREVFNDFGIKTSIECPQERRAELVARLRQLAA